VFCRFNGIRVKFKEFYSNHQGFILDGFEVGFARYLFFRWHCAQFLDGRTSSSIEGTVLSVRTFSIYTIASLLSC